MRGTDDRIYDLLNSDFSRRKAITVQDFTKDWARWMTKE
jgi:hypothetical protein